MLLEKLIKMKLPTSSGGGYRPIKTTNNRHSSPHFIGVTEKTIPEFECNIQVHCSVEELNILTVGVFSLGKTERETSVGRWNKSTHEGNISLLTAKCLYEEEKNLYRDLFNQAGHAESYMITSSPKGEGSIHAEFVPIKLAIQPSEGYLAWATEGYFYHFVEEKLHMEYQVTGDGKWSLQITFSRGGNLTDELVSEHQYTSCVLPYKINQSLVSNQYIFYQQDKLTELMLSEIDACWLESNALELDLEAIVKSRHEALLERPRQEESNNIHTVKLSQGPQEVESWGEIAAQYSLSPKELLQLNPSYDSVPLSLKVGDKVLIRSATENLELQTSSSPIARVGWLHLAGDVWGDYQTNEISDGAIHILEDKTISSRVPVVNVKTITSPPAGNPCFYYTPFSKNLDVLIYEAFGMFDMEDNSASIIFDSADQAKKFTKTLEVEKDIITAVTAVNRGMSKEESQVFFEQVDIYYQAHHQIKYNNDSDLPPVIRVLGHGRPEGDSLSSTPDESEYIFTFELAKKLKDLGLPSSTIIRLDFCWSACQCCPENCTKEEAINHINNGDFESLFGDTENSFLGEFTQEIKNVWPEFKGEVEGYYGSVLNTVKSNVLSKGGSWVKAYATEIELTDGILLIHKDEFKKTIKIE